MSPPKLTSPAGWYAWAHPGCALRIFLSLDVVDRLQREILASTVQDRELGGLLIGSKRSGVTRVYEFVPLPVDTNAGQQHYTLSPKWLNEIIARCPSDSKVVGYYRTDLEQLIRLRPDDVALMNQRFKDPSCVCLVIAPAKGAQMNAGFFCWQGASLPVNPSLTFPLSAVGLASNGWPLETQEPFSERASHFFSDVFAPALRGADAKAVARISLVLTTSALLVALVVSRFGGSSSAPPTLGLQVNGDGTHFLLSWNPESRPVKNAKEASLLIWDSSRADSDGNSEPLHLPLTVAKLRSGEMTYTSFSPSERVRFRLDVTETSGYLRSEAVACLTPVEALKQEQPPQAPPARVRQPAVKTTPKAVRPVVAAVTPPVPASKAAPPTIVESPRTPARIIIPVPLPDAPRSVARAPANPPPEQPPALSATVDTPAESFAPTTRAPASSISSVPGMVTITSEPSGAEVQINAVPAGLTPITLQISPVGLGFTVTVSKAGYMKWSLQTFATDKPYSLHAQLKQSLR
ncbi:MAG TPA: PEGA domain-containing protein [Bryobacteraceae bacterium]|nr:PEGA domain-containing protein [Bryobacteraceae bacterium]